MKRPGENVIEVGFTTCGYNPFDWTAVILPLLRPAQSPGMVVNPAHAVPFSLSSKWELRMGIGMSKQRPYIAKSVHMLSDWFSWASHQSLPPEMQIMRLLCHPGRLKQNDCTGLVGLTHSGGTGCRESHPKDWRREPRNAEF